MNTIKRIMGYILLCAFCSCIFISCKAEGSGLPEYIYNKSGESIGYIEDDFIFNFDRFAVAEYDKKRGIFFNKQGYIGEIYKGKYLIYNENSKYINIGPQVMSVKPIPLYKMKQASIQSVRVDDNIKNIFILDGINFEKFDIKINSYIGGWVGANVDFYNTIEFNDEKYVCLSKIEVKLLLNATYQGHNNKDYALTKIFTGSTSLSANNEYLSISSIYNYQHYNYSFYKPISITRQIISASGILVEK